MSTLLGQGCDDGSQIGPGKIDEDAAVDAASDAEGTMDAGVPPVDSGTDAALSDGGAFDGGADASCLHDIPTTQCDQGDCPLAGSPCGFAPTGAVCVIDTDCGAQALCFERACYAPDLTATADGCVEAAIRLVYGGAAPDRIYSFMMDITPTLMAADGSDIMCANGMEAANPVPLDCSTGPDCFSYYGPVSLSYDDAGLHASGSSGFTLHKLRGAGPPVGATWSGTTSLTVTWTHHFQFGAAYPENFASYLIATVWSVNGGCASRTKYGVNLIPNSSAPVVADPVTTTLCP